MEYFKNKYNILYFNQLGSSFPGYGCKKDLNVNMPHICEIQKDGKYQYEEDCAKDLDCIDKWYIHKLDPKNNPENYNKSKKYSKIDDFVSTVRLKGTNPPPKNPNFNYIQIDPNLIEMQYSKMTTHPDCLLKYKPKNIRNKFYIIRNFTNVKRLLPAISNKNGSHLFIVSDFHGHQVPESITMSILLNNPKIKRIFLEFDYRMQKSCDDFIRDGNMHSFLGKIPYLLRSFKDVYNYSREHGIELICVDEYPMTKSKTNDNELCRRNKVMAENINKYYDESSSDIFIVGGRHIEYEFSVVYHLDERINTYLMLLVENFKYNI